MRLDKFLKVSRIIKRRTVAKDIVTQGRVQVNERPAKAGTEIAAGDQITIQFGTRVLTVQVEHIQETTRKESAAEMYTVLQDEKVETETHFPERD